jgi:UPF0716 family protein affecting phage T7 exclusion
MARAAADGTNRNSAIALAIFMAMVALWLLRNRDVWSVDEWLKRRRTGRDPVE